MNTISTNDINEATFYLLNGGVFVSAEEKVIYIRKYKTQQQRKTAFRKWHIHLKSVPIGIINVWWYGMAKHNIRDFMAARDNLKKTITNYIHNKSTGECQSDSFVAKLCP